MPKRLHRSAALATLIVTLTLGATAANDEIKASRRTGIVRAVDRVAPTVVSINTFHYKEYPKYRDPFFDYFFESPSMVRERVPGIGSGFVIREDGYVLTNSHVVENAREISVTFPDGKKFDITDVANDVLVNREKDLAVLRIDIDGLEVPEFGDSDSIIIGEWAIAIGNPFGLTIQDPNPTVTVGVISAGGRDFRPLEDGRTYRGMIQTDASINPGNSGGPLVNSVGQVIGINAFIFEQSKGSQGIGFAIPINNAIEVADQLIDGGSPEFWTGVVIQNLNRRKARALGLATTSGALILTVNEASPSQKAGLTPGDVIVQVNGFTVRSADEVVEAFREGRVGAAYDLMVLRGRTLFRTRLVLERDPQS
ncbi:MAG: 2-alkenal reductase [Gemmatimonadetes bacterium]|nr:2-alkenal reductase [Gemmatimonadota bacterium]